MKISGTVVDTSNEVLGLANVNVKGVVGENGKKLSTIADYKGKFELDDPNLKDDTEIVISYLGYLPQTLKAKDLKDKKVVLSETAIALNEVIVPPPSRTIKVQETKQKFIAHLQEHKATYASLGAITGLALIVSALKTK